MKEFAAVIIDSRPLNAEIIRQHLAYLEMNRWRLFVFSATRPDVGCELTWIPYQEHSVRNYNWTLAGRRFWLRFLAFQRVLIFQQDSGLLRNGMEEFCALPYDYIGAPWPDGVSWARSDGRGGNGGLSLRNPRAALLTTWRRPYQTEYGSEDIYFTRFLANPAPKELCRAFSCETLEVADNDPVPLGWHAYGKHHGESSLLRLRRRAQAGGAAADVYALGRIHR